MTGPKYIQMLCGLFRGLRARIRRVRETESPSVDGCDTSACCEDPQQSFDHIHRATWPKRGAHHEVRRR